MFVELPVVHYLIVFAAFALCDGAFYGFKQEEGCGFALLARFAFRVLVVFCELIGRLVVFIDAGQDLVFYHDDVLRVFNPKIDVEIRFAYDGEVCGEIRDVQSFVRKRAKCSSCLRAVGPVIGEEV